MYDQFKPFVGQKKPPNRFWPVAEAEIIKSETRLGFTYPSGFRSFLLEVGHGFFGKGTEDKQRTSVNRVLDPDSITDMVKNRASEERPPEGFPKGAMPFFDLGEYTYLLLKPRTNTPNRVYAAGGDRIVCESVEEFFSRLYRNASFYRKLPTT